MKFKIAKFACSVVFLFISSNMMAQLTIDADLRARFEYRHGSHNLFPDNADPAAFVVQRSRLNIGYETDRLKLMLSPQDVSVWGDTRQILVNDGNDSFSIFQAWAQYFMNENWSIKAGRQVISYDDQRVMGGLDWAMQGRFHDAALLKYKDETITADLGLAFGQESQRIDGTPYTIQGFFTYKTMQYLHLSKKWNKASASLLILNNGFQKFEDQNNEIPDGVFNRQTVGTYFEVPVSKIKLAGSFYYQFGKANANTDLNAFQASLLGAYNSGNILYELGYEIISGTDQEGSDENNSFFPLYGTNHKFNGFMDYFYVGNHANNVGLNDLHAKMIIKTGENSSFMIKGHYFASNADLINDADKYLGTEIDLAYTQNLVKFVKLSLGYSQMFASDSMSLIKGGRPSDNTNNWGYAALTVNPRLFSTKKENLD